MFRLPLQLQKPEPQLDPRVLAALKAELGRLTAKVDGPAQIEVIYAEYPGPVTRRRALLEICHPRIRDELKRCLGRSDGAFELNIICEAWRCTFELMWAERQDELIEAAPAADWINLRLMGERSVQALVHTAPIGAALPDPADDVAWVDQDNL